MVAFLEAATSWLLFAALIAALGSVAARWVLVPRAALAFPEAGDAMQRSAARLGLLGGGLLPVAMAAVFARQLHQFRDPFAPLGEDARLLLFGTDWGRTWLAALALAVVAAAAYGLVRSGARTAWWPASLAVVGLAAYPAFSGHASATEGLRPLTLTADTLHVLAAGAWVGGLAFVLASERAWRRGGGAEGGSVLPTLVPLFSPVAIAAVATLVLTGALASFVNLGGLGALFSTAYGRVLLLKLAAVAAVLALGLVNWRRLTPRLGAADGRAAMRRSAAVELLAAQVVLAITAVLVGTSPLAH